MDRGKIFPLQTPLISTLSIQTATKMTVYLAIPNPLNATAFPGYILQHSLYELTSLTSCWFTLTPLTTFSLYHWPQTLVPLKSKPDAASVKIIVLQCQTCNPHVMLSYDIVRLNNYLFYPDIILYLFNEVFPHTSNRFTINI